MTNRSRRLAFKPFDDKGEVRIYSHGFLPHWRQKGCTYFVTFRTADSVPKPVIEQWRYERQKWLDARNIDVNDERWRTAFAKLPAGERSTFQKHFAKKLFAELDHCHGACPLRDFRLAQIVADAMLHFDGERVDVGDFVVMPNHVHGLLTPLANYELETILHSVKSFTANKVNSAIGRSGSFWMNESHDHLVRDSEELLRIQEYIRMNPKKAKLRDGEFLLECREFDVRGDC